MNSAAVVLGNDADDELSLEEKVEKVVRYLRRELGCKVLSNKKIENGGHRVLAEIVHEGTIRAIQSPEFLLAFGIYVSGIARLSERELPPGIDPDEAERYRTIMIHENFRPIPIIQV